MKNLLIAVDLYSDFVSNYEEYRTPDYFARCAADTVVNYWRTLLFVPSEGIDNDDATKAEEALIYSRQILATKKKRRFNWRQIFSWSNDLTGKTRLTRKMKPKTANADF